MCFSESISTEPKATNPWELWKEIYLSFVSHPIIEASRLVLKLPKTFGKQPQKSIKQTKPFKSAKRKLQKHIGASTHSSGHPFSAPSASATHASSSSTQIPKLLGFLLTLRRPDAS